MKTARILWNPSAHRLFTPSYSGKQFYLQIGLPSLLDIREAVPAWYVLSFWRLGIAGHDGLSRTHDNTWDFLYP